MQRLDNARRDGDDPSPEGAATTRPDPAPGQWRSPALRRAGVLAVLLIGVALGLLLSQAPFPAAPRQAAGPLPVDAGPAASPGQPAVPGGAADPVHAPDARSAVEAFVSAEIAGDYAASWELLSAADRAQFGSPAAWAAEHAAFLPITGFELEQLSERLGAVEAVTLLRLRSGLDEFAGLVPARARATWVTAPEDGRWTIRFTESSFVPLYPPEDGAGDATRRWAAARQACDAPQAERDRRLLGAPALAERLCGAGGTVAVGAVAGLPDGPEVVPFVDAFGPEVFDWARVVPLSGPVALRAVLAPVDDAWVVIGVLAA